ncbi:hypothetical protein [Segniliparus rugosus]|uniref:Uncharacterized protein n=1 Tax=Segniliparus rugosus (strain ATCC BAA-974 / DSM 45345 / CCUG 50838 / CIP 108380 / JCM 13579 / CDC 945) TaxID=679197 RepID=E5XN08_SEGRC|nr:hypothetical protein [Segniliparus rugosus]EFV14266.1 hypothetical protein HMPREF9336_00878 [Segniliparus rugosus ATCC BAA-974]
MSEEIAGAKGHLFKNKMTICKASLLQRDKRPGKNDLWWFGNSSIKIVFKGIFGKADVKSLNRINDASVA